MESNAVDGGGGGRYPNRVTTTRLLDGEFPNVRHIMDRRRCVHPADGSPGLAVLS
jgi:hypothetical protein